jgi:hypothetical protein
MSVELSANRDSPFRFLPLLGDQSLKIGDKLNVVNRIHFKRLMIVIAGASILFAFAVTEWRTVARAANDRTKNVIQTRTGIPLSYYLTISGGGYITVKDEFGHSNTPALTNAVDNQIGDFIAPKVPNVSVDVLGEETMQVVMPVDQTYTISFRSGDKPMEIELIKGEDNRTPERAVRYKDLLLPPGVSAMLKISGDAVEKLRYDKDGDGIYETAVEPTIDVSGPAARDITPPVLSFAERLMHGRLRITIGATDRGSGVEAIYYSLDNKKYERYTQPLVLDMRSDAVVYAFADDRLANRSSVVSYKPKKRR